MITIGTAARRGAVMLITMASFVAIRPASKQVALIVAIAAATATVSTTPTATPATWGRRVNTKRDIARGITKATSAPIAMTRIGAGTAIEITMAITTAVATGA